MRRPRTPIAEQYRLVMDCRQSGLSDTRWCEENGIQPSTFYNWVNRLRKKGCEIPPPTSKEDFFPVPHQDVVRVDLIPDVPFVDVSSSRTVPLQEATNVSCLRLELGGAKLDILILSILVYTFFSRMFDLMLPPVVKHSTAVV